MKKIIFGITSLTLGGAERVLIDIVNELSSKFDITIFTLYGKGEFEKRVPENVKLVSMLDKSYNELNKVEKIKISLKLLLNKKSVYQKYINKGYDTEIAFLEGPVTRIFSVRNSNIKKIAWVHNDIGKVFGKNLIAKIKRKLDQKVYLQYNDIVFVSNDNKIKFEEIYGTNNNNKIVIPNYVSSSRILEESKQKITNPFDSKQPNFLTVARLTNQKAIDRLIKVHSKLIENSYYHKFYIIGDGPERQNLEKLIKQYDVKETFILLGKKENPYPYMKKCDIFALLSYYEGLPMTVIESKVLNKPILITDTAARECVEQYPKSCIVDNTEEGIYEGIKKCIESLGNCEDSLNTEYSENDDILKKIEELVM